MKHRPRLRHWRAQSSQGEAWCYQAVCTCGQEIGAEYFVRKLADADLLRHRMDVAPPVEERCRSPRDHRMKPWDRCPLCADQLVLPGFEDIA